MTNPRLLLVLVLSITMWGCGDKVDTPRRPATGPAHSTGPAASDTRPAAAEPVPAVPSILADSQPATAPGRAITADQAREVFWWTSLYPLRPERDSRPPPADFDEKNLGAAIGHRYADLPEEMRPAVAQSLRKTGGDVVAPLLAWMSTVKDDLSPLTQHVFVKNFDLLVRLGDKRAAEYLVGEVFNPPAVSDKAAEALDRLEPAWRTSPAARSKVPSLLAVLEGKPPPLALRGTLTQMLDGISPRALPMDWAIGYLEIDYKHSPGDPDRQEAARVIQAAYQTAAAAALANLGERSAVPRLIRLLQKSAAQYDVAPAGDRQPLPSIHLLCRALQRLDAKWHESPAGQAAMAGLLDLMRRGEKHRERAIEAMTATTWPQAFDVVLAYVKTVGRGGGGMSVTSLRPDWPQDDHWRMEMGVDGSVLCLARTADRSRVPLFLVLARDTEFPARADVVLVLGHVGGPDAVAALTELAKDKDERVQRAALFSLGFTGSRQAIAPLAAALSSSTGQDVRLPELQQAAIWSLGSLGFAECVPPLAQVFKRGEQRGRWMAIQALARIADPSAKALCLEVMSQPKNELRYGAAMELASQGQAQAGAVLMELIQERLREYRNDTRPYPDRPVISQPCRALCRLRMPSLIGQLVRVLGDGWPEALLPLMATDDQWPASPAAREAVGDLIQRLDKPDPKFAIHLLGRIGDQRAFQPLVEHAAKVRDSQALIDALDRLDKAWRGHPLVRAQAPKWIALVQAVQPPPKADGPDQPLSEEAQDQYKKQRVSAIRAARFLGEVGDASAAPALRQCFTTLWPTCMDRGNEWDHALCGQCAWALGKIKSRDSFDVLIAPLQGEVQAVHRLSFISEIADALGEIGDKRAIGALLRLFDLPGRRDGYLLRVNDDFCAAARAVAKIGGSDALEGLLQLLADKPRFTYALAPALALLGDKKAVIPLLKSLNAPTGEERSLIHEDVRAAQDFWVILALDRLAPDWRQSQTAQEQLARRLEKALGEEMIFSPRPVKEWGTWDPTPKGLDELFPDWRTSAAARDIVDRIHRQLTDPSAKPYTDHPIQVLGMIGDKRSAPVLLGIAASYPAGEQEDIFTILDRLDPGWTSAAAAQQLVGPLARTATTPVDPERTTRYANYERPLSAARLLGRIGTRQAKDAVLEAMRINGVSRQKVEKALSEKRGDQDLEERYSEQAQFGRGLLEALAPSLDHADAARLLGELANENSPLLLEAACLGEVAPALVPSGPLLAGMAHDSPRVREAAAMCLFDWTRWQADNPGRAATQGEPGKSVEDLIRAMARPVQNLGRYESHVRPILPAMLGETRDPRAVQPLLAAVRSALAEFNKEPQPPANVPHIIWPWPVEPLAVHQGIALSAGRALGRLGDAGAVAPAIELLNEVIKDIRAYRKAGPAMRDDPRLAGKAAALRGLCESLGVLGHRQALPAVKQAVQVASEIDAYLPDDYHRTVDAARQALLLLEAPSRRPLP